MSAKDKTSPFTTKSARGRGDGVISEATAFFEVKPGLEKELAAASERFAAVLRTAPVAATMKTGLRDSRHARFSSGERLLWTTTFESEWHRYIGKPILKASTTH
jgi:hypothetical protein